MLPASSAYIALNMGTASGDMAARNSARLRDLDIWYHSAIWPPSSKRANRSEEHTSELQSLTNLVCRLLLEKKNTNITTPASHKFHIPPHVCQHFTSYT